MGGYRNRISHHEFWSTTTENKNKTIAGGAGAGADAAIIIPDKLIGKKCLMDFKKQILIRFWITKWRNRIEAEDD